MKKRNFKYIARKGSELDLDELEDDKRSLRLKKAVNFIDSLFFKDPFKTFSGLILLVALPITLYLTLETDLLDIRSKAGGALISLAPSSVEKMETGKNYEFNFKLNGENITSLEFLDVKIPNWLQKGSEVGSTSESSEKVYKIVTYTGLATEDLSDRFALLSRGKKTAAVSECSGCDKDSKYVYALAEFNFTTGVCDQTEVYGRNPVGKIDYSDDNSYCQSFESNCFLPSTWKEYTTRQECLDSQDAPKLKNDIEDKIFRFEVDCDGKMKNEPMQIDEIIEASDTDGDIVRFSAQSRGDFLSIKQDNIEKIVKTISGSQGKHYSEYDYSVILGGEITSDFIGKTTTVKLHACDSTLNCKHESFEVSAIKRGACRFVLPVTGSLADVDIASPEEGSEISGVSSIILILSGSEKFDVKLDLYNADCADEDDFISNIATYYSLTLDGERGIAVSFDSRSVSDDSYCVKVFARDASLDTSDANWEDYASRGFRVRNDNTDPEFITTPPDGNLTTGDSYEYVFEARDADGDELSYDVIGAPSWINIGGRTISGSTTVPGGYNFVIFVDDGRGGYTTQQINITVSPPENQPSVINFEFPAEGSVISGDINTISWDISDNEGVSQIELYYSQNRQQWTLIGTYPSSTSQANWDVSGLENGDYYLMLVVTDESAQGAQTTSIIGPIHIANEVEEDEEEYEDNGDIAGEDTSMPAINNMTPEPDSEIDSRKPLVSASFHPSDNASVITDEVEVYLDDVKINSICEISQTEVLCQIQDELDYGRHKVKINIEDSSSKSMTEEWYFTIVELDEEEEADTGGDEEDSDEYISIPFIDTSISKEALIIASALCFVALLLILIPWLIYYIWSKRTYRSESDEISAYAPGTQPIQPQSSEQVSYSSEGYDYSSQSPLSQPGALQTQDYQGDQSLKAGSLPHGYSPQENPEDRI